MKFFKQAQRAVNEFNLQVIGAGGAVWAIFYAIPEAVANYFCRTAITNSTLPSGGSCERYLGASYMFVVIGVALLATANAAYLNYTPAQEPAQEQAQELAPAQA